MEPENPLPTSMPVTKPEPTPASAPVSRPVPPTAPAEEPVVPQLEVKRFIRTFATDMEALKEGKAAGLAPEAQKPAAPVIEALPEEEEAAPLPAAQILPSIPSAPLSQGVPVAEPITVGPLPRMPEVPSKPVPPPPPPPPPVAARPSPIQTYDQDFSKRLKESNASKVTVLAAELDAGGSTAVVPKASKSSVLYMGAGLLFLILGGVGAYAGYRHYLAQNAPIVVTTGVSAPIFVDEEAEVSGTGTALLQAIEQSNTRPLAPNAVRLLYRQDGAESIFTALELPAPGILLRNTEASGSMAGIVNSGSSQTPFFIVSVTSYSSTFSGMLSWEPRMAADLKSLFPPPIAHTASTTAATSSLPIAVAPAGVFKDKVIANQDARVYTDASGVSIVYGYWDPSTLIIARDEAAFTTIVSRLATSRKQ